jgi:hypothetical protein
VRRICVSKKKKQVSQHGASSTSHPRLFAPRYQFKSTLGAKIAAIVVVANSSSSRTRRCLPYIGAATSCAAPAQPMVHHCGMTNLVIA